MRTRVLGWIAGAGLGLVAAAPAMAEAATSSLKIAVVNIDRTVKEYKKRDILLKNLQLKIDSVKRRIAVLDDDIPKAEEQLKDTKEIANPDLRDDLLIKLELMRRERQVMGQWLNELNNRENNKGLDELLKDVQAAIKKVGEKGGYDIVLQSTPGPVLYIREGATFDVTTQVIELLNKDFEAGSEKPPEKK